VPGFNVQCAAVIQFNVIELFDLSLFYCIMLTYDDILRPACVTVYPPLLWRVYPLRILAGVSSRRRRNAGRPPASLLFTIYF
jgi:hypothetical protein